ncbi:hypothetical protein FHT13_001712 [Xanthomonas arboricola]|nr:hypothetical protein [Xanthomonas arboricola]
MAKTATAYSCGKLHTLNLPSLSSMRSNNSFKPTPRCGSA